MAGQKDYTTQIIGVPHGNNFTIAQVGCFLYSSREILGRFGHNMDLLTLNQYFVDHHLYVDAAPKDNIFDDLDYGTLTKVEGSNVAVVARGAGAPSSNNSIVKFIYRSPNTGNMTTHFCAVIDAAKGLILDSWDAVVKHWSVYGGPVEYASYDYAIKAAAQVDPHPDAPAPHSEAHVGQILVLPASIDSWRVYKEGGPWDTSHAIHSLAPAKYGGLEYEVVGNPAANIYLIDTKMYGRVAIYAGSDTPASFKDKAAAAVSGFTLAVNPINPDGSSVRYKVHPGARQWNLDLPTFDAINTAPISTADDNTFIEATSTLIRSDLKQYTYLLADGNIHQGYNAADVDLAPAPVAVAETASAITESAVATLEATPPVAVPTFDDIEAAGGFTKAVGWFRATDDSDVYGNPGIKLEKGNLFHRAATFTVDGQKYAISFRSIENRTLYGVTNEVLTPTQAPQATSGTKTAAQAADDDDNLFEEIFKDISQVGEDLIGRAKTVASAGRASHSIRSIGGIFHKKKKG